MKLQKDIDFISFFDIICFLFKYFFSTSNYLEDTENELLFPIKTIQVLEKFLLPLHHSLLWMKPKCLQVIIYKSTILEPSFVLTSPRATSIEVGFFPYRCEHFHLIEVKHSSDDLAINPLLKNSQELTNLIETQRIRVRMLSNDIQLWLRIITCCFG